MAGSGTLSTTKTIEEDPVRGGGARSPLRSTLEHPVQGVPATYALVSLGSVFRKRSNVKKQLVFGPALWGLYPWCNNLK